jgi:putative PIN family toxin of toxin-antitoxin system
VPRAVLDTNVLVSALISPTGPSAGLLLALHDGAFELVVSPLLLAELRDVLMRPKFRPYVAETEVDAYVALIRQESVVLEDPEPSAAGVSGDPDDEYLIDLARAARVDALVSGDAHLLDLRDALPVRSPREFLDELSGTTST